jgi:hypothetical protein
MIARTTVVIIGIPAGVTGVRSRAQAIAIPETRN